MKLLKWLWAFVPAPAKAWVIGGLVLAAVALLVFSVYKIQEWGYDRCEAKHEKAAVVSVDQKLDVKVKQDEIQNAPIDNGVTVRRLRSHNF
jgi:sensor domain CHASE-containing protein